MKKVCHLTSAHQRYDVRIFEKECVSLANAGYSVTLVVNDNYPNEIKNGVEIISTSYVPKNRLDRMIYSTRKVYMVALEINADIYHFHDPELLPIGNKLKKAGKIVIFDAHEDTEVQILDKKWIPIIIKKLVAKSYKAYSRKKIKSFDAIISVTPHIVDKFYNDNKKTFMITNYPIISDCIDEVQINNKFMSPYICFAGGVSEQWMHDKIINAIEEIDGIKYVIAGGGSDSYFELLKTLEGWKRVEYIGKVPHNEVKKIYASAIAGMAVNYCSQIKETGSLGNTKIFEYMEAGVPIICSDYPIWKEIIKKYNCGIYVNPNDSYDIKKAITYLYNNPRKAKEMGHNGRIAATNEFNWKHEERKLIDLYKNLL